MSKLNIIAFEIAPIFYKLLAMSITAVIIGIIILLIRKFADKKIPPLWKYILWGLTIFALVVPFKPDSNFALIKNISAIENISYRQQYDSIRLKLKIDLEPNIQAENDNVQFDNLEHQTNIAFWKSAVFDVTLPLLWLFCMIVGFINIIVNKILLSHKIKKHTINNDKYNILLIQCKQILNIQNNIKITVQNYISTPALIGIFKPQIILPKYADGISDENLSYIILHELSHFKRKDMIVNYLLILLQTIYWFNPLILIIFKLIREDMELLNDTYVLKHIDTDKSKNYARSLVEILAHSNNLSFVPKLLCMVDGQKNIKRRIEMIRVKETFTKHKLTTATICILIITLIGGLFLTQRVDINETKRQLTQNEINKVNKSFEQIIPSLNPDYEYMINPICHFFSSYYEKPQDINLEEFIWYMHSTDGFGELSASNTDDIKQFNELKKLDNFPFKNIENLFDMNILLQRKSINSIDDILKQYAGITTQDLTNTSNVLYLLEPYNSFYTYTSDAGAAYFTCVGGEIDGNIVRLLSLEAVLTLEKKDDTYLIVSHIKLNI